MASTATRVDQGERRHRPQPVGRRRLENGEQLVRAAWQLTPEQVGRRDEPILGFGRGEDEQGRNDDFGCPTERPRCLPARPGVPAEAAKDPAGVVDLGLDLDAQQHPIRSPIGEDVDPAARSAVAYLHLGSNMESVTTELPNDGCTAPSVDHIPLRRSGRQPEAAAIDVDPQPEHDEGRRRKIDVQRLRVERQKPLDRGRIGLEPSAEFAV